MALMRPRQTKFQMEKYYIKSFEYKANKVRFGAYGIMALEGAHITAKQIKRENFNKAAKKKLAECGYEYFHIYL